MVGARMAPLSSSLVRCCAESHADWYVVLIGVLVPLVQYPEWFNSRFGNKLWYTGVGAKEILGQSPVNLPGRLQARR